MVHFDPCGDIQCENLMQYGDNLTVLDRDRGMHPSAPCVMQFPDPTLSDLSNNTREIVIAQKPCELAYV
jgi:hypothetical protein